MNDSTSVPARRTANPAEDPPAERTAQPAQQIGGLGFEAEAARALLEAESAAKQRLGEWERAEARTPTDLDLKERRVAEAASTHADLEHRIRQKRGDFHISDEQAAADAQAKAMSAVPDGGGAPEAQCSDLPSRKRRQGWRDTECWDYAVAKHRKGRFATCKELYDSLFTEAGSPDSPFEQGTNRNRGRLVVKRLRKPVALPTMQNAWGDLNAAASKQD